MGAEAGMNTRPSTVDLHPATVVHPRHAEDDLAFGLDEPLEEGDLLVLGVALEQAKTR